MPDTKITALAAITTVDPAADVLPIVDISDTSMAASGTTKKITSNQILGAGGTATLASATITGDLTVRTTGLTVNSSGVGVGITAALGVGNIQIGAGKYLGFSPTAYITPEDNVQGARIKANQVLIDATDAKFNIAGSEAMRLNSTGLGVGVASPATKLDVRGAANANQATFSGTAGRGLLISTRSDSLADDRTVILNAQYATGSLGQLVIQTAGTDRLLVDNAGNVGIGVTPSAWAAGYKAIQIAASQSTALMGSGNQTELTTNAFFDGAWKYQGAGTVAASRYSQQSGVHYWYTAAAGAAGIAIGSGFTNAAMTLDASGRLILLASTTTPATLATNGQLTFTATSNTNLRFSYRGSDGVTRTADLTLA